MKKILLFITFIGSQCIAQIPAGYYNSVQGLTANPLFLGLHNIIKGHTQLSYNALWNAYPKTDKKPNGDRKSVV